MWSFFYNWQHSEINAAVNLYSIMYCGIIGFNFITAEYNQVQSTCLAARQDLNLCHQTRERGFKVQRTVT